MRRRGFTIIELSFVLAVMALLVAVTVPTYHSLMLRAQTGEARAMLSAIAHAEQRYRRDHGQYLSCGGDVPIPKAPAAFDNGSACWRALGLELLSPVRYRYTITAEKDGYTALAEGDLDGDGLPSRFALDGRSLGILIQNEFE